MAGYEDVEDSGERDYLVELEKLFGIPLPSKNLRDHVFTSVAGEISRQKGILDGKYAPKYESGQEREKYKRLLQLVEDFWHLRGKEIYLGDLESDLKQVENELFSWLQTKNALPCSRFIRSSLDSIIACVSISIRRFYQQFGYIIENKHIIHISLDTHYSNRDFSIKYEDAQDLEGKLGERYIDQIPVLPGGIDHLTHLRSLILSHLRLTELPTKIGALKKITRLIAISNNLTSLPPSFGDLHQLQELDLDWNKFDRFPEEVTRLSSLVSLSMRNTELNFVPESIAALKNLRRLDLSNNHLTVVPPGIECLGSLQVLTLANNKIRRIPESLGALSTLKVLHLGHNLFETLPETFGNLSNLHDLILWENNLTSLPDSFGNLSNLETLWSSSNELKDLPDSMKYLKRLRLISLRKNEFEIYPEVLNELPCLKSIDLSENHIQVVPEKSQGMPSLEEFQITKNKLKWVPRWIFDSPKIREVDLRSNPIIPFYSHHIFQNDKNWIQGWYRDNISLIRERYSRLEAFCSQIQEKIIQNQPLDDFDKGYPFYPELADILRPICDHAQTETANAVLLLLASKSTTKNQELKAFREFWLIPEEYKIVRRIEKALGEHFSLKEQDGRVKKLFLGDMDVPEQFVDESFFEYLPQLRNIDEVSIDNLPLNGFPEILCDLQHLESLFIFQSNIPKIPASIRRLTSLKHLTMRYTSLEHVPDSLGNLTQLSSLILCHNSLKKLPPSIGNCTNLKYLNVSNNKFRSLPDSIGDLRNLKQLHIANNQLEVLPDTIGNLYNLQALDFEGNRLISIPNSLQNVQNLKGIKYHNISLTPESRKVLTLMQVDIAKKNSGDLSKYELFRFPSDHYYDISEKHLTESDIKRQKQWAQEEAIRRKNWIKIRNTRLKKIQNFVNGMEFKENYVQFTIITYGSAFLFPLSIVQVHFKDNWQVLDLLQYKSQALPRVKEIIDEEVDLREFTHKLLNLIQSSDSIVFCGECNAGFSTKELVKSYSQSIMGPLAGHGGRSISCKVGHELIGVTDWVS